MRYLLLALLLLPRLVSAQAPAEASLTGFNASSRNEQAAAEKVLMDAVTPASARRWLAALTEEPHVAGTPAEKKVADYVLARFKEFGLETEIVRYDVFLNHPKHVSLKLTSPVEEELSLREEPFEVDKDSTMDGMFPAFHGYGASGTAEGQVVYVNYGTPADYTRLAGMGISVDGKIALARYGAVFRGLKVKEAQDRGALGVLIYSDPADDGYMRGDLYPDGPMRPGSAIQRGSVLFLSHVPGDPSTPGWPSTSGAKRLPRDAMANVPKIPSLPIAYDEAEKILRRLGGPRVPDEWQGGLPFAYHIGPGLARVAMDVQMDEGLKPIYNVIGRIRGSVEPEKLVIAGNHRDAWNHGAVDPNSGTAAQIELARGLAAAMKTGWRPKRTILLASWDAEEYGLVGSTEWAEEHAAELQRNAVAYLNCDSAATGPDLGLSGTPSLLALAMGAARDVPDPKAGGSVGASWESRQRTTWAPADADRPQRQAGRHVLPSSGPARLRLGLHRLHRSPRHPVGGLQLLGQLRRLSLRLRQLPVDGDVRRSRISLSRRGGAIVGADGDASGRRGRAATALFRPTRAICRSISTTCVATSSAARARRPGPDGKPAIAGDFTQVLSALQEFSAAGESVDRATDAALSSGDAAAMRRVNDALMQVERAFLDPKGLPNRPWFRHMLIAPGLTTGYAPWPFPALQEAVENRDAAMWTSEMKRVVAALGAGTASARGAVPSR